MTASELTRARDLDGLNRRHAVWMIWTKITDSMLDSELAWRESVAAVGSAYRTWCAAPDHDRGLSLFCYVAALDQEEAAAAAFAASSLQVEVAAG